MPPRHFGDNSTRLPAFLDNARLSFRRPPAPSADTRNHLDPPQTFQSALSTLKRLVLRITKSMLVHGRTMAPPESGWKVGRDHRLRWINYYGRYAPSALSPLLRYVNQTLVAWARRKFKRFRGHTIRASCFLQKLVRRNANLFVHWQLGMTGTFA